MADFKTHISTSTTLGIAYGTGAYFLFNMEAQDCMVAAGLCSLAGMLPDLDSDSGVPVRETLCFVSAVIPMLMVRRFAEMGMSPETMVLAAAVIYVGIRFGVGEIFKRYTVHRGMWHSIPAALIAGMVAFLVCLSNDFGIRMFKAWAVVMGFLSHLILDELYSIDLGGKRIRIKKSFGTALKFWRHNSLWANISTYGKLIILAFLIAGDATVMKKFNREPIEIPFSARDWILDRFGGEKDSSDPNAAPPGENILR